MDSDELLTKLGAPACSYCGALIESALASKQKTKQTFNTISALLGVMNVDGPILDGIAGEIGFTKHLRDAGTTDVRCAACKTK